MMKRSDFLRLGAAPIAAPLLAHVGDAPVEASLVFPDGRRAPWRGGIIDVDRAATMGVERILCEDAPDGRAIGCVWADPARDRLGVHLECAWEGADVEVVEEDFEWPSHSVAVVRTHFRVEMADGSYILSRGRSA